MGPGFIRTYDAVERRRLLDGIAAQLERIDTWHSRTTTSLTIRRGSLLEAADALSRPFQASHKVNQQLTNAADHLHALRTLFIEAKAQHIYAPYTLIRPALEGAVGILYTFTDATPVSVALTTLRDEYANINEMHTAAITIGVPVHIADAEKLARAELLDATIDTAGFRRNDVKGKPKSTTGRMEAVAKFYRLGRMPLSMWQMCSAASHGTRWALPMLAMFDAEDDGKSETVSGRIVSDEATILHTLTTACDVLERAFTVVEAYSRPAGHTGKSFILQQGSSVPHARPAVDRDDRP